MAQLPTNPADFSIAEFAAWVRTKPAEERYDYSNRAACALCQFLKDTGRAARPLVDMYCDDVEGGWSDDRGFRNDYPAIMEPALSGDGSFEGDPELWTFGALASRLEALAPEPSIWISVDAYMSEGVSA